MPTRDDFHFQPGWDTPVVVDYRKPGLLARFVRFVTRDSRCLAEQQGRCPGEDQCHDCAWSPQEPT